MPEVPLVLLVEDNDDEAELARRALRRASSAHRLLRARDGVEALELARQVPDVVLLDLKLPRLDGKQVLRSLRGTKATRHVPVVVVSASGEAGDLSDCYSLSANSYVRKPVDLSVFTENLSLILYYWLALNIGPGVEAPDRRRHRQESGGVEAEQKAASRFAPVRSLLGGAAHARALTCGEQGAVVILDRDDASRSETLDAISTVSGMAPLVGAGSAAEAFRILSSAGLTRGHSPWAGPRLVLIDIDHHLDDGPPMMVRIREQVDHRLPIVFFTRKDDPVFIEDCYSLTPNSVVRKPDSPSFADTVRLIGHYWLRLNETVPIGLRVSPALDPA